jgi:hypothetical protein
MFNSPGTDYNMNEDNNYLIDTMSNVSPRKPNDLDLILAKDRLSPNAGVNGLFLG